MKRLPDADEPVVVEAGTATTKKKKPVPKYDAVTFAEHLDKLNSEADAETTRYQLHPKKKNLQKMHKKIDGTWTKWYKCCAHGYLITYCVTGCKEIALNTNAALHRQPLSQEEKSSLAFGKRKLRPVESFDSYLEQFQRENTKPDLIEYEVHVKKGLRRRRRPTVDAKWGWWERICKHKANFSDCTRGCVTRDHAAETIVPFSELQDPFQFMTDEEKRRVRIQHLSGFVDGDGCFVAHAGDEKGSGANTHLEIGQARLDILETFKAEFGGRVFLHVPTTNPGVRRTTFLLKFTQHETGSMVDLLAPHLILKYDQALLSKELCDIMDSRDSSRYHERRGIANRLIENRYEWKSGEYLNRPYDRLCIPYISGLFDAEGCCCISTGTNHAERPVFIIELTQKSNVIVLEKIKDVHGGFIHNYGQLRWESIEAHKFLSKIVFFLRQVKRAQAEAFLECFEL